MTENIECRFEIDDTVWRYGNNYEYQLLTVSFSIGDKNIFEGLDYDEKCELSDLLDEVSDDCDVTGIFPRSFVFELTASQFQFDSDYLELLMNLTRKVEDFLNIKEERRCISQGSIILE